MRMSRQLIIRVRFHNTVKQMNILIDLLMKLTGLVGLQWICKKSRERKRKKKVDKQNTTLFLRWVCVNVVFLYVCDFHSFSNFLFFSFSCFHLTQCVWFNSFFLLILRLILIYSTTSLPFLCYFVSRLVFRKLQQQNDIRIDMKLSSKYFYFSFSLI